jgi:hypothetical protein
VSAGGRADATGVPPRAAWTGVVALVTAAVIIVLRQPAFFTAPRFWAEEGSVFFLHAWTHPWWQTLLFAPQGYLVLYTNLAAIGATLVPLEHAPLVTTLAAFALQLLPVALIAWSRAPEWAGGRWVAGIAIVLFAGFTDEVWLNSTTALFHWPIVAFLVLLEPDDAGGLVAWVHRALLVLAVLSSPLACALLPLFVVRAWRARSRESVVQGALVVVAALVQAVTAALWVPPPGMPSRAAGLDLPIVALAIWVKMVVLPTLGDRPRLWILGPPLSRMLGNESWTPIAALGVLLAWLGFVAALGAGLPRGRRFAPAAYVLLTALTVGASLGEKRMLLGPGVVASRYGYAPGVLLFVLLLGNVRRPVGLRSALAASLLAIGLALGVSRYPTVRWEPGFPQWRAEVAAWRRDPRHALAIWPPGWMLPLP